MLLSDEVVKENILHPKVQYIIWKEDTDKGERYLAKFRQRSYYHCKWFSKEELKDAKINNFSFLKSMQARMRKTINLKLSTNSYFNPNFTKVDRILAST